MILTIKPRGALRGTVFLPPSKSYSIRAFLIASLGGASRIIHPSLSKDARVAMRAAKFLGSHLEHRKNSWTVIANRYSSQSTQINVEYR